MNLDFNLRQADWPKRTPDTLEALENGDAGNSWIGVDLDGTLAEKLEGEYDPEKIGEPNPAMVERVQAWLDQGQEVRIFTARAAPESPGAARALGAIRLWCIEQFGIPLPITNRKDPLMSELWDDLAVPMTERISKRYCAQTRTRSRLYLVKANYNQSQPRDDRGRWVRIEVIEQAAQDPGLADDLRRIVKNPDERAKLETAISTARRLKDAETQARAAPNVQAFLVETAESEAEVFTSELADEAIDRLGWESADVAAVVGAPDDADVMVDVQYAALLVNVKHAAIESMERSIVAVDGTPVDRWNDQTQLMIHNERLYLHMKGRGIGSDIIAKQVAAASRRGIVNLTTLAAKSDVEQGYAVWPKLGYDASLFSVGRQVQQLANRDFPEARTVGDINQTVRGQEWWEANGATIPEAVFDLDAGSRSMQTLVSYLESRKRISDRRDQWTTED